LICTVATHTLSIEGDLVPIVNYKGPPGFVGVLQHLIGERIDKAFVDAQGALWLVVPSGHALVIAAFHANAIAPFWTAEPHEVEAQVGDRRRELQKKIQELKNLAPGIDV
jgi:hypothetical protein